jgi:hypothetical protein
MRCLLIASTMLLLAISVFADPTKPKNAPLPKIIYSIAKEPVYRSQPKYCLLAFHQALGVFVWMVEDGDRLFVDKNANGDLTDDGNPLEPTDIRGDGGNRKDFSYKLDAICPADGSRHTHFQLRRWNYGEDRDSYGLSLRVGDKMPMYAGWFGTFWSDSHTTAPIIRFAGPFKPVMLRRDFFEIGESKQRLSLGLFHPGSTKGAESRLSIEALPDTVVPVLTILWPSSGDRKPLLTTHPLKQRCCYWEFYTTDFEVPQGTVAGDAKVTLELPTDALPAGLTTNEITIPVRPSVPKPPDK